MSGRIAVIRRADRRAITILLELALGLSLAACQGASSRRAWAAPLAHSPKDILLAGEIGRCPELTLYEVVQSARPLWLWNQGRALSVSLDGGPPGGLDVLRIILASDVREVRLLHAFSEAQVRPTVMPNGNVAYQDVLVVLTRLR